MAKIVCCRFTIENDNGFEVSSLIDTLREIILCLPSFITPVITHVRNTPSGTFLNQNDCEVEDLVELDTFDTKWTGNIACSTRYTF